MEMNKIVIGFDLKEDMSQIHFCEIDAPEQEGEAADQVFELPTTCRIDFSDPELAADPAMLSQWRAQLEQFAGEALHRFSEAYPSAGVEAVTFTCGQIGSDLAQALRAAAVKFGVAADHVGILSHKLSFAEYALSQKRELWTYNVGLFEYDSKGLFYYELEISRNQRPITVGIRETDLTAYLSGGDMTAVETENQDEQFNQAILKATEGQVISSFYLTGKGFDLTDPNGGWMKKSVETMISKRRRLFGGQNLYARGACEHSLELCGKKPQADFMILDSDLAASEIYIQGLHKNTTHRITLFDAGTPWYEHGPEKMIIAEKTDHLVICMQSIYQKIGSAVTMTLEGMPERPRGTTKLAVSAAFDGPGICKIKVRDLGFGELFPATGKVWETSFDMKEPQEPVLSADHSVVIETTENACTMPLDLRPSGIRLFTLEELCWYISQNYFEITDAFFDEVMFYWMDSITGSKDLSSALKNYQVAERPVKDLVRLLLGSVDYLNNAEITSIYNQMSGLERQNPVERMRTLADYEYDNGRYMQALKNYMHVIWQLEHSEKQDETSFFTAETYGNAGLTLMQLHDLKRARHWLEKAVATYSDRRLVNNYAMLLLYEGDEEAYEHLISLHVADNHYLDEIRESYKSWEAKDREISEEAEKTMLTREYCESYISRLKKDYRL